MEQKTTHCVVKNHSIHSKLTKSIFFVVKVVAKVFADVVEKSHSLTGETFRLREKLKKYLNNIEVNNIKKNYT